MSIYKIPKGVLNAMESIRCKFFNGFHEDDKKITWVAWDKTLASKSCGGLGVSSLFALNRALLFKWVWRFIVKDKSLWLDVITAVHGNHFETLCNSLPSWTSTWIDIVKEVLRLKRKGIDLLNHCSRKIGDGNDTCFWKDIWIGSMNLMTRYPRLYALEKNKIASVAEKMVDIHSSFRRNVRDGVEKQQYEDLLSLLSDFTLSPCKDRWRWDLNGDGTFKVKDARNLIDDALLPSQNNPTRWNKLVPKKVNIMVWRLILDKLPTKANLGCRGVNMESISCPICESNAEDIHHLFFGCQLAKDLFRKICLWWDLSVVNLDSFSDWMAWFNSTRMSSRLKEALEGICYVCWWIIWGFRNQKLFGTKTPTCDSLFDDVVSLSFLWCSNRCRTKFVWGHWIQNPAVIFM